jgi:peptidoglycan/LPS O-acetylase OafA/YrhL
MKFRTDINGLRAIAVMAVVLFHFNSSWVSGGFAGVDVFFVISGFLMTGLIFRGLENNNFSIINFYVARANRIIPALSVVCLALLVFGWFYLTPLDYRTLGKHVASSMGFVSNIIYWRESGYFDAASHSKWLLHTWSLSVEWQFYMIYPVVLVLLKKCMSLTNIKRLLVVGTVIGFIFSVYATYRWPNPAYFLFPTRAWEMMMGGLAFIYPLHSLKETSKKYFEWVGIALILASYAFISKDSFWPGYLALIPVLGAYLIIIANRSGSVITGNIVMQKVGLWSYSIYLWHWPVVVFGYYFQMQYWEWIGIPISVVLGFCSYKFVESIKFPALSSISFKPITTFKPLWMVVSISVVSLAITYSNGVYQRYDPKRVELDKLILKGIVMPKRNNGYCFYSSDIVGFKVDKKIGINCFLGKKNNRAETLLFGDSYAGHNEPFWDDIFKVNGKSFRSVVTNYCAPSFSSRFTGPMTAPFYKQCLLNRAYLKESIENKRYKNIILAGSWYDVSHEGYLSDLKEVVSLASKKNINVLIMPTPPSYNVNVKSLIEKNILGKQINWAEYKKDYTHDNFVNDEIAKIFKNYKNVRFISRKALFEKKETFTVDGIDIPYSLDGGHMSLIGSKKSADYFMRSDEYKKIIDFIS